MSSSELRTSATTGSELSISPPAQETQGESTRPLPMAQILSADNDTSCDAEIARELHEELNEAPRIVGVTTQPVLLATQPPQRAAFKCGKCGFVHMVLPIPNSQFKCVECGVMNKLGLQNGQVVVLYRPYYPYSPMICTIS